MTVTDDTTGTTTPTIDEALDTLGITPALNEGDVVTGALLLLKVTQDDGSARLSIAYSDGLAWAEQADMIRIADPIDTQSTAPAGDDGTRRAVVTEGEQAAGG